MKLIRFGRPGQERPGLILPDQRRIDASGFGADYDEEFFGSGGLERLAGWLAREGAAAPVVADDVRLGPPLCRPSKIVCVGLNYRDHARESGMAVPEEPVLFFKATSAITGPNDDVIIPRLGTKVDWEVELAVVIGRRAAYVGRDDVPRLVSYISQFMTLLPGDIISTGTPSGVGLGQSPPRYLADGDVVELGIDGLGSARQRLRA